MSEPRLAPEPDELLPRERILARLGFLYGDEAAPGIADRLEALVANHLGARERVYAPPCWDEASAVLITYGDSIQSPSELPLRTLHEFLKHHLEGAFSAVHILPFFPFSSDDGFSITDYRAVRSDLGDWPDIQAIAEDFDLMADLVLNHCSRENLWFIDFIEGNAPGKDYFIEVDPQTNLSDVVRPRSTPLLSKVRTPHGMKHVWATFSNDQIDLNFANPDVLLEFVDTLLFYLRMGTRIVRLDAVAFLWKIIGSTCIHLPQTHEVVKLFRDIFDAVEPGCLLLTETNVPNAENLSYFGDGDEAQMVYQFSLPPLLLHALYSGSARHLNEWAAELTDPPEGCTFLNFTASHDGVGLRPLEGLIPTDELNAMLDDMRARGGYISTRRNKEGHDSPYELNISYFDACGTGPGDELKIPRFLLSQTLAMSLKGVPAVYVHSLVATPNDHIGVERTGATRSINRRKLDIFELERRIADRSTDTSQVFHEYLRRLEVRSELLAFHPDGGQVVLDFGDDLFVLLRTAPDDSERILCVFNITPFHKTLAWPKELEAAPRFVPDLLSGRQVRVEDGELGLGAYACLWLRV